MQVDHVLLTRFNLPSVGVEEVIRAREGWLRERMQLFERYCLPAVLAQQGPRPKWLIYLDPHSPVWLLERMGELAIEGTLAPVLRETVSRAELVSDLRDVVPHPGDVLITTNLDNDDGLAPDFSARLRAVRTDHARSAVYLTRGIVATEDALFLHTDRNNAFCSVREPWAEPVTAWAGYHNELSRSMPVVHLQGPPGWLQVVHGRNVSNRVRGRRVDPAAYRPVFPGVRVPDSRRVDLVRDRLVDLPVRWVRDTLRAAVRTGALRLLGKERYGAAKLWLSRTLGRA